MQIMAVLLLPEALVVTQPSDHLCIDCSGWPADYVQRWSGRFHAASAHA
jgi:hypothetical protein